MLLPYQHYLPLFSLISDKSQTLGAGVNSELHIWFSNGLIALQGVPYLSMKETYSQQSLKGELRMEQTVITIQYHQLKAQQPDLRQVAFLLILQMLRNAVTRPHGEQVFPHKLALSSVKTPTLMLSTQSFTPSPLLFLLFASSSNV